MQGKPRRRTAARVDRRLARRHRAEWAAALCVIASMAGLFLMVQPKMSSAEAGPVLATLLTDLRPEDSQRTTVELSGKVTRSASAIDVLEVLGASREEASAALEALRDAGFIERKPLPPGTSVTGFFEEQAEPDTRWPLVSVSVRPDPRASFMVTRQPDGAFAPARLNARIRLSQKFVSGAVTTSLPETIRLHGGSADVSDLFARPVPTARSTGVALPGDRYELVYMAREDEHGHDLGMEDLLFAGFTGPGRTEGWYRFTPADTGVTDFYRADGLSYSQLLARYPIGRVRINSGFGKRTHPVSGEQLLHKGIDFGVPEGSEVLAAGDGVIGAMAWGDGYGKYVRIHHPDGYETVYAHLKGYKSGLKPGQTVRRGDMIGFVGDTGTATGAHLHYEIRRNGRVFDPMKLEFPANRNLQDTPEIMQAFREQMARIDMTRGRYEPAQAASAPAPGIRAKSP